jgi:hypothetical protein
MRMSEMLTRIPDTQAPSLAGRGYSPERGSNRSEC